jgi:predicted nucleotidyltransferase
VPDYSTIRTQFVRDRLRETRWEDREYIQQLMGIERILSQGGPRNSAARLVYERLVRRYPVEHGAIFSELHRGELTSDSDFHLLSEAQQVLWRKQEQLSRDLEHQEETKKVDRLNRERSEWLRQGGLE